MLKPLQTAVFEKQPPVSIHGGLMCVCIYVPVLLYCASPCLALLQFGIPDQRLFKSMTAPAGKMKAVIFSPPSLHNSSLFCPLYVITGSCI